MHGAAANGRRVCLLYGIPGKSTLSQTLSLKPIRKRKPHLFASVSDEALTSIYSLIIRQVLDWGYLQYYFLGHHKVDR